MLETPEQEFYLRVNTQELYKKLKNKEISDVRIGETITLDRNSNDNYESKILNKGTPLTYQLVSALYIRGFNTILIIDDETKLDLKKEEISKELSDILKIRFEDIEPHTPNYNRIIRYSMQSIQNMWDIYGEIIKKHGIEILLKAIKAKILEFKNQLGYQVNQQFIDGVINLLSKKENINGLIGMYSILEKYDKVEHSIEVMLLSMIVANNKGYAANLIPEVGLCALLHDIGFSFVDNGVLTKLGELSEKDKKIIKFHTLMGYMFLPGRPGLIAGNHHEIENSTLGYGTSTSYRKIVNHGELDPVTKSINNVVGVVDKFVGIKKHKHYKDGRSEIDAIFVLLEEPNIDDNVIRGLYKYFFGGESFKFQVGQTLKMTTGTKLKLRSTFGTDEKKDYIIKVVGLIPSRMETAIFDIYEAGKNTPLVKNTPIDFSDKFQRLQKDKK